MDVTAFVQLDEGESDDAVATFKMSHSKICMIRIILVE
jgi:hypothetical protein